MLKEVIQLMVAMLCMAMSVGMHEGGHYVVYKKLGGEPYFGYEFISIKKFIVYIAPKRGEEFYDELRKSPDFWKNLIFLSGSGMLVTAILVVVFTIAGTLIDPIFFIVSVFNFLMFIVNFISETSDGYKIIMAIKYRKDLDNHLKEKDYKFNDLESIKKALN